MFAAALGMEILNIKSLAVFNARIPLTSESDPHGMFKNELFFLKPDDGVSLDAVDQIIIGSPLYIEQI